MADHPRERLGLFFHVTLTPNRYILHVILLLLYETLGLFGVTTGNASAVRRLGVSRSPSNLMGSWRKRNMKELEPLGGTYRGPVGYGIA